MRIGLAAVLAVALGMGLYWSLKLGYADRLFHTGSTAGVERARQLASGNAAYFAIDSTDETALRQAVAGNPRLSSAWVELGILAEAAGNLAEAERCLLEAARVDRTYQPAWSLANFYFRCGQSEKFWPSARRAAEMAYFTQTPLFRLYWQVTQDPATILSRGIPERGNTLAQYVYFLLTEKKLTQVESAAERLLARSVREDLPVLTLYCDHLIGAGDVVKAMRVWNSLSGRGLIPYETLEPSRGRSLTNGDFSRPPLGAGFDWRLHPVEGVTVARTDSPPALRFTFSGKQPEHCVLLEQVLPLEPGLVYRLAYSWRASGVPEASGLRWYVAELGTGRELASVDVGTGAQGALAFTARGDATGARLVLEYRRTPGTTRIEGTLWLRAISSSLN